MSKQNIPQELSSVLEEALNDSLDNYEVKIDNSSATGNGFLGEMVLVEARNKSNNKMSHFAVKQARPFPGLTGNNLVENSYFNEIHFYKNIWKEFQDFRNGFPKAKIFDHVPRCFAVATEKDKEAIVMENLRESGFEMFPRNKFLDDGYVKFLMDVYGRFHGLSAAFREHNPERFNELTDVIKNASENAVEGGAKILPLLFGGTMEEIEDENVKRKMEVYKEKAAELAIESLKYNGKNPVLNHGDCWSNNMLFKYDDNGALVDVKLIDFQLCRKGSVVLDLTYFLYSGTRRNILDNLDLYLKIYHDSFSETVHSFDLDPAKIFTFQELKEEFREYFQFGFVMSHYVWPIKLSNTKKAVDSIKNKEAAHKENNHQEHKRICAELVTFLHENEYL